MKTHQYFISSLCMAICITLLYGHAFADEVKVDSHLGLKKLELNTSDDETMMVKMKGGQKYFESPELQSIMRNASVFASMPQDSPERKTLEMLTLARGFFINYVNNGNTSKVFGRYGVWDGDDGIVIICIHSIERTIWGVNITFRAYVNPPTYVQLVGFKANVEITDIFGDTLLKTDLKYSQRCVADVIEFTRTVKADNERANGLMGVAFTDCKDANIIAKWGQTLDVIWGKEL